MQIKKLVAAIGVAGAFMMAQSAFAISGINEITGPDSENLNEWNISGACGSICGPFVVDNVASVTETPYITVDTGSNTVSPNTVVGDVATGDIFGALSFDHKLNTGTVVVPDLGMGSLAIDLTNSITGPNSTNTNIVNIGAGEGEGSDPSITNQASFYNTTTLDANTGNNSIDSNTQVGNISTGDIDISIASSVSANKNNSSIVMPSMPEITGSFTNSTTGPGSTNENILNITPGGAESGTYITNTSDIVNDISATLNTGNNTVSNNTVVGNISTGSVKFSVNVSSEAN